MKSLRLDFIKCIVPQSRTLKHFLTFLPDAYLATKIPDMSGKNLTYGNPIFRYTTKTPIHLGVKSETRNVTVRCRDGIRMMTNKSVGCSNAPQETTTDCGYVGLQAIISTVGLFANKYITLNHEWNITGITQ